MVVVMTREEAEQLTEADSSIIDNEDDIVLRAVKQKSNHISVGLVGNPNSGKTSRSIQHLVWP